jgi:hypothetical protein
MLSIRVHETGGKEHCWAIFDGRTPIMQGLTKEEAEGSLRKAKDVLVERGEKGEPKPKRT